MPAATVERFRAQCRRISGGPRASGPSDLVHHLPKPALKALFCMQSRQEKHCRDQLYMQELRSPSLVGCDFELLVHRLLNLEREAACQKVGLGVIAKMQTNSRAELVTLQELAVATWLHVKATPAHQRRIHLRFFLPLVFLRCQIKAILPHISRNNPTWQLPSRHVSWP